MGKLHEIRVLGIMVHSKGQQADLVQSILTKYGCSIRTRLGLNTMDLSADKDCGLILLELTGNTEECLRLENDLLAVEGVRVQKMIF